MTPAAFFQTTMSAAIWTAISLIALAGAAFAAPVCRAEVFEGAEFTVCEPAADDRVELFHSDADGNILGTFDRLARMAESQNREVIFAMNGGMYHPDRRPVGLYIENGVETAPLVTREGPGNFGLLPNGVFCLSPEGARVVESRRFAETRPDCDFATQSGPMLVIDGALHPRFLPASDSRFSRNGVGVTADGRIVAVIADDPVNFHQFARFFRDVLKTPNALFLDGKVSRLFAPELGRRDLGFPLGPMLAVTRPID